MKSSQAIRLAIDLGASGGRVIAAGIDDGKLTLTPVHRFVNQPIRVAGSLQWDVVGLWEHIQEGLSRAGQQFETIASVGVDSWGVDFVLLREDGLQASPAWCHRDARNVGTLDEAFAVVPRERIFAATGLQFLEINSLYQLINERKLQHSSLDIATCFLMIGDFIHYLLSGVQTVESTNASTTQLLDPRDQTWRDDLMDAFRLPRSIFPDVTLPGTRIGTLQESVQERTGLGDIPVIAPATHDTASAVLAVPAESFAPDKPAGWLPDWCYISCGTWSLMGCELGSPELGEACQQFNLTNEGGVLGSTRLLRNIGGLWVFQQIRTALMRQGETLDWDDMVDAALQAPALRTLIDPDAPELLGPPDMVDAIDTFVTRTGQCRFEDHGALFRAALEGLALRYRATLDVLEEVLGRRLETIHLVGGGSQNALLCQMTADACDRVVIAGPVEATAIGNFLMQAIGDGELASVDEARALVRNSFPTTTFAPLAGAATGDRAAWDDASHRFSQLG
ncbi:MAG: rhamnulokinase family protein [Planctomycetota bacterium]